MTQAEMIIENARVSAAYLQALVDGYSYLAQVNDDMTSDELRSIRNQVLAGDSLKAAFLGTLSTEPTVLLEECKARGLKDAEAEMVIAQRDEIRQRALGLVD